MKFHHQSRKIPLVPIIPLIDILAILLIYFAVEYDPKEKRNVLNIELALAQDGAAVAVEEPAAVLAIAVDGSITLDATRVQDGFLVDYLKVFKKNFPNRKLELEPDKGIALERFIEIQNALIDAGFNPREVPSRVKISTASETN